MATSGGGWINVQMVKLLYSAATVPGAVTRRRRSALGVLLVRMGTPFLVSRCFAGFPKPIVLLFAL